MINSSMCSRDSSAETNAACFESQAGYIEAGIWLVDLFSLKFVSPHGTVQAEIIGVWLQVLFQYTSSFRLIS